MVLVTNLPHNCSVLSLKSRLEMYGGISRTRIDGETGYVSFRSRDSAEAAISASLDPSFGITLDSQKVLLSWPGESLPQWRDGVRLPVKERLSSKLLQPEVPLSKRGRGKKLDLGNVIRKSGVDLSQKPREIIAYDDLF